MRFPSLSRLIPSPQRAVKGLAYQVVGVVVLAVAQKYVPNVYGRWAVYIASAGMGVWYPLTRALLSTTGLDKQIEDI